jgi:hypothetical protein
MELSNMTDTMNHYELLEEALRYAKAISSSRAFPSLSENDLIEKLEAALAEPKEPVAWLAKDHEGSLIAVTNAQRKYMEKIASKDYWEGAQPLFTHPPMRELSDEEITNIIGLHLEGIRYGRSISAGGGSDKPFLLRMRHLIRACIKAAERKV